MQEEPRKEETQEQPEETAEAPQPEEPKAEQPEPQEAKEEPKPRSELPKRLVNQTKRMGGAFPKGWSKLKEFWVECKRVLRVTKKPDKAEFMTIVKVSAIGMAVIGVIGFVIHMVKELLF